MSRLRPDRRSPEAQEKRNARKLGYDHRWDKARLSFLAENPLCKKCQDAGIINDGRYKLDGSLQTNPRKRSPVVDHIIPHKGDMTLFWDRSNWQTLCSDHHDRKTREDEQPYSKEIGLDGFPIDPRHPANQ